MPGLWAVRVRRLDVGIASQRQAAPRCVGLDSRETLAHASRTTEASVLRARALSSSL
jgi:hypothetical protein